MSVTGYDEGTRLLSHLCPGCEQEHEWEIHPEMIVKHREDRGGWSLALGPCPICLRRGQDITHHLNLNLPDDHPHPSAGHINRMLRHHLGGALPAATLPAIPLGGASDNHG